MCKNTNRLGWRGQLIHRRCLFCWAQDYSAPSALLSAHITRMKMFCFRNGLHLSLSHVGHFFRIWNTCPNKDNSEEYKYRWLQRSLYLCLILSEIGYRGGCLRTASVKREWKEQTHLVSWVLCFSAQKSTCSSPPIPTPVVSLGVPDSSVHSGKGIQESCSRDGWAE